MISRMRNEDRNWKRKAENGGEENLINFSFFRFFLEYLSGRWGLLEATKVEQLTRDDDDDEWHAERCEKLFFQ